MSSQNQLLSHLRSNYINAKNDYFRYLNTYNKDFWNTLIHKFYTQKTKKNIRLMIIFNKMFILQKIQTTNTTINQTSNTHTNINTSNINSDIQTTTTVDSRPIAQTTSYASQNIKQSKKGILKSNNTNLTSKVDVTHTKSSKTKITTNTKQTVDNSKDPYNNKMKSIIKNIQIKMKHSNMQGKWCYFKKFIFMLYNELTSYYSTLNKKTFKTMSNKGLQNDIVKLLDIYKQNYNSFKLLFNDTVEQTDIVNNPEKHPLIQNIIKSFYDDKFADSFITLINSTF
tara:strand:+ start:2506 stop:3354 length:849 start_codon:yes stop_codon:yes gene_type:complete